MLKRNPTDAPCAQPLLVADTGAVVAALAGMGAEAGDGGAGETDAGVAGLVGRTKGPFCPQPVSSPALSNNSDTETK